MPACPHARMPPRPHARAAPRPHAAAPACRTPPHIAHGDDCGDAASELHATKISRLAADQRAVPCLAPRPRPATHILRAAPHHAPRRGHVTGRRTCGSGWSSSTPTAADRSRRPSLSTRCCCTSRAKRASTPRRGAPRPSTRARRRPTATTTTTRTTRRTSRSRTTCRSSTGRSSSDTSRCARPR